jgi:hypothetical protein
MITRAIRLLLAGGFLAAVAHVAPVAERVALEQSNTGDSTMRHRVPRLPCTGLYIMEMRPAHALAPARCLERDGAKSTWRLRCGQSPPIA